MHKKVDIVGLHFIVPLIDFGYLSTFQCMDTHLEKYHDDGLRDTSLLLAFQGVNYKSRSILTPDISSTERDQIPRGGIIFNRTQFEERFSPRGILSLSTLDRSIVKMDIGWFLL